MSETTKTKVIHLLEEYPENKQRIALLRYELEHPATVTSAEIIDAMTFTQSPGEGRSIGTVSDKTHNIAANYEAAAARMNAELMDDLVTRLFALKQMTNKLEYYVGLLPAQEQTVIQLYYFKRITIQEIADEMEVSVWLVRRRREEAVKHLCEMYEFVDTR